MNHVLTHIPATSHITLIRIAMSAILVVAAVISGCANHGKIAYVGSDAESEMEINCFDTLNDYIESNNLEMCATPRFALYADVLVTADAAVVIPFAGAAGSYSEWTEGGHACFLELIEENKAMCQCPWEQAVCLDQPGATYEGCEVNYLNCKCNEEFTICMETEGTTLEYCADDKKVCECIAEGYDYEFCSDTYYDDEYPDPATGGSTGSGSAGAGSPPPPSAGPTGGAGSAGSAEDGPSGPPAYAYPPMFAPLGGIAQVGPNRWLVAQTRLDEEFGNLGELLLGAASYVHYHPVTGAPDGFQLGYLPVGHTLRALGLKMGDVIQYISGKKIDDAQSAFVAFMQLKDAPGFAIGFRRMGQKKSHKYQVIPQL